MPPPDVFGRTIDDDEEFTLGLNMNPSLSESRKDLGLASPAATESRRKRASSPSLFKTMSTRVRFGSVELKTPPDIEMQSPAERREGRGRDRGVSWADSIDRTPRSPGAEPRSPTLEARGFCAGCCAGLCGFVLRCWRVCVFCATCGYCVAWATSCCGPPAEPTGDVEADKENEVLRDQFSYTLQARYDRERWRDDLGALSFPSGLSPKSKPMRVVEYPGDYPKQQEQVHALQRSRAAAGLSLHAPDRSRRQIHEAMTGDASRTPFTKRFSVVNQRFDSPEDDESSRWSEERKSSLDRPSSGTLAWSPTGP